MVWKMERREGVRRGEGGEGEEEMNCCERWEGGEGGGGRYVPSRAMKMMPSSFIRASSTSTLVTPSRRPFVHVMGFTASLDHCTPVVGVLITKYAVRRCQIVSQWGPWLFF